MKKERKFFIKFTDNTMQYTIASVQLVETYVALHTTIHHDFRAVSGDIYDSSYYNTP